MHKKSASFGGNDNIYKRYSHLFSFNDQIGGDSSSVKLSRPTKLSLTPINPEFMEKVMQIKNNKLTPNLQVNPEPHSLTSYNKPFLTSQSKTPQAILHTPTRVKSLHESTASLPRFHAENPNFSALSGTSLKKDNEQEHPQINKNGTGSLVNVSEVYENINEFTQELDSIINCKFDENLRVHIESGSWREFLEIQRMRLRNSLVILDRTAGSTSIERQAMSPKKIFGDLIKILRMEFTRISQSYEDCINKILERVNLAKPAKEKTVKVEMDLYSALKALIDYSNHCRMDGLLTQGAEKDKKIEGILASINEFKIRSKLKKNFDVRILTVFEELEQHIKDLNFVIERQKFSQERLVEENKLLIANNKEDIAKFKDDNLKLIKQHFEQKNSIAGKEEHNMPLFKEKNYQNRINDMEYKVKDLTEKNKNYEEKYKKIKVELSVYQVNPENARKQKHDKSVGVNFYADKRAETKAVTIQTLISTPALYVHSGANQQRTWVADIISLMLCDKLITDLCDDHEKRPRKTLHRYISEWFLKRYGLAGVAETLIKDFLYNVKTNAKSIERFGMFAKLAGIEEEEGVQVTKKKEDGPDGHSQGLSKRLKEVYYKSIEAQKIYLTISTMIRSHQLSEYAQGPFLPCITARGGELIHVESARTALLTIFKDEKMEGERIKEYDEKLKNMVEEDLYYRVEKKGDFHSGEEEEEKLYNDDRLIRFDFFVNFMVEQILELRVKEYDQFLTSMRIMQQNKVDSNLSYDEFVSCCSNVVSKNDDKKTFAWLDHAFDEMISAEANADKITFDSLLLNMIPTLTNQYYTQEFYLKSALPDPKKTMLNKPNLNKLISLQITSRTKALFINNKNPIPAPAEILPSVTQLYDVVSAISLLYESYEVFRDRINLFEKNIEPLAMLHDEFKEDLGRLPQNIHKNPRYEAIAQYVREDLVNFVEGCWKKLRSMLGMAFRPPPVTA